MSVRQSLRVEIAPANQTPPTEWTGPSLECCILAHGFLRLRCGDCGHDKLVAFSCERRGSCPSCAARRTALTSAHLVDHVIPHVPVRHKGECESMAGGRRPFIPRVPVCA